MVGELRESTTKGNTWGGRPGGETESRMSVSYKQKYQQKKARGTGRNVTLGKVDNRTLGRTPEG